MPASQEIVGFIGLGNMGWPMARRLAEAGYKLVVYDIDHEKARAFAAEFKAEAVRTCAEVSRAADRIVTMLPNSQIVEDVMFGNQGLVSDPTRRFLLIEMSSGVPSATKQIADRAHNSGIRVIDAPVSGGVPRAITGELAIMVGGAEADVAAGRPLLEKMGTSILPTGAVGSAHAMKALNNLVSACGFMIGIEALIIGERFGLNPGVMVDVLNAATGMNNSTQKKFKQFVLSRAFNSGFSLDLMVKDIKIATQLGSDMQANTPLASLCRDMWSAAAVHLGKGQDHTAAAKFSEYLTGGKPLALKD